MSRLDFSCVGGLHKQVQVIKEIVLFPLLYGHIYTKFHLKPPRGILFYGPPGTGKTLVATALANECSKTGKKVNFISRNGADCLSKWIGESEQNLQEVFRRAEEQKPCIIFFDEIDALAPSRNAKNDIVHSSLVSIMLTHMDGINSCSEIVVIGATNRLEAIDPALRRSGRFDRELYFPLPCYSARKEILSIHVKKWKQKPAPKFIAYLAANTIGYCGSDLQALCTQAVICCMRRTYPEIYNSKMKLRINDSILKVDKQDFMKAREAVQPAFHNVEISPVKCLSATVRPLLHNTLTKVMSRLYNLCPVGMLNSDSILDRAPSKSPNCARILLCGIDDCHTQHLAPAILLALEHLPRHTIDLTSLFDETDRATQEKIIQFVKNARMTLPSILYIPNILSWWYVVNEEARIVLTSLIQNMDRSLNLLIIVTATAANKNIPPELTSLFQKEQGEVYEVERFTKAERFAFFRQLFEKKDDSQSFDSLSHTSIPKTKPQKRRGRQSKKEQKSDLSQRQKLEPKSRSKLKKRAPSTRSSSPIDTKPIKREYSSSDVTDDEIPSKRMKLLDEETDHSLPSLCLSKGDVKECLNRLVNVSSNWLCCQLERRKLLLEGILENMEKKNAVGQIQDCINSFLEAEDTTVDPSNDNNMYT